LIHIKEKCLWDNTEEREGLVVRKPNVV